MYIYTSEIFSKIWDIHKTRTGYYKKETLEKNNKVLKKETMIASIKNKKEGLKMKVKKNLQNVVFETQK